MNNIEFIKKNIFILFFQLNVFGVFTNSHNSTLKTMKIIVRLLYIQIKTRECFYKDFTFTI